MPSHLNWETIAKNTLFLTVGELTSRVLSFLLVIAIARHLGNVGLGAFAFAFAFMDILLNVADLGLPTYLMREIAKDKQKASSYISNILGLRLIMAPIVIAAGIIAALLSASTAETQILVILATLGTAISFLNDPFRSVFLAYERASYYSIVIIIERAIFTVAGIAMLASGRGLIYVVSFFALGQLVSLLITTTIVRKKFTAFSIRFETSGIIQMLKSSVMFGGASLLRMINQRVDVLMLSAMHGFAATGIYSSASRITESLRFMPLVLIAAVFPVMSRLHLQSKETLSALYEKTIHYLLIIIVPMIIGITIIADRATVFFYGGAFAPAADVLRLLILAESLLFLHYIMGFLLGAINKQHLFTISTAFYTAANIILNILLVPSKSYIGAGIAAVATQGLAVLTLYYFSTKNGYPIDIIKLSYKPAIAGAGMAAALILMKNVHLLVTIPVAGALYAAILFLVKGIGKEELNMAKKLMHLG
ncbi:flippase [Candidatus Woesearchaeota archaeon]|nr:flippase [Candidatus Woesearchaeota archaeon]